MRLLRRLAAVILMLGFDAVGFALCYFLAYVLRRTLLMNVFASLSVPLSFDTFTQRYYLILVYLVVFAYEGLYTKRLVFWEEIRRTLRGIVLATVLVVLALYVTKAYILSRSVVLLAMLLSFFIIPVVRTIARKLTITFRLWSRSVLVVGSGRAAQVLTAELTRHWRLGYQVAAVVSPEILNDSDSAKLANLLREYHAESIILPDAALGRIAAGRLLSHSDAARDEVIVLLDSTALRNTGVEIEQLESLLLMKYRYNLLQPYNYRLKRAFDLVGTVILLVATSPLFLLLALIVKLSSPGKVLFRQKRIGRNQKPFYCLKFRTMWQDADQRLERLLASNPSMKDEWTRYSRITNDPRITPIGRILRRFSLDELPQLWNVLCGEMSLIGPRPYMPREISKIGPMIEVITRVRPGMSGLFQVSGRKEVTFEERLLFDEHYVKNWSLWMDIVLLTRTLGVVISGKGAV